jgi:hypothetical protein
MGEALFEISLAEKRSQGSEGPPHRIPDFLPPSQQNVEPSLSKAVSPKDARQHQSGWNASRQFKESRDAMHTFYLHVVSFLSRSSRR